MTTATPQAYAVYQTAATSTEATGYVVNRIVWDGVSAWTPPAGCAVIADPANQYPIGSTYSATAGTSTAPSTAPAATVN